MKPTLFIIILINLIQAPTHAQDVFLHVTPGNIFKLEADYTLTLITTETYSGTFGAIGDIAISPDHNLYGISISGEIISIDWTTGSTTVITQLPPDFYNALTCSATYDLYTLTESGNLYAYNLLTNTLQLVDQIGKATPGDLTFYRGNILFQSATDGHIKAFHIANRTVTTVLCRELPLSDTVELWGISNSFEDCETGRILATDNANHLYLLHIDEGSIEHLQYYEYLPFPDANAIYGMASDNEYLASECSHTFTEVDCNVSVVNDASAGNLLLYPNPTTSSFQISTRDEIVKINMLDATGRSATFTSTGNGMYDISVLPTGMYYVCIHTTVGYAIQKMLKY